MPAGKPYRLFYRDVVLGEVVQEDADFPNLFGRFRPSDRHDQPAVRERLRRYIAYSIEADRLAQREDDDGEDWERFVDANEHQFVDLIDCDDWYLLDAEGRRIAILIPNFGSDGVVWRYNPQG